MSDQPNEKKDDRVWMTKKVFWTTLIVILLAFSVVTWKLANPPSDEPTTEEPKDLTSKQIASLKDDDSVMGDPKAPIQLVEFTDYQCPFCGRLATGPMKEVIDNYVKTGKASLTIRDFPLPATMHPNAFNAAMSAECAGEQKKSFEMGDLMFAHQSNLTSADLKRYATSLGLDMTKFNDCFDNQKMKAEIEKDFADASAIGVRGVPVVYINGKAVYGAQPYVNYQTLIEAELK